MNKQVKKFIEMETTVCRKCQRQTDVNYSTCRFCGADMQWYVCDHFMTCMAPCIYTEVASITELPDDPGSCGNCTHSDGGTHEAGLVLYKEPMVHKCSPTCSTHICYGCTMNERNQNEEK